MEKSYCILIVDDDEDILTSARLLLKQHYSNVHTASDPREINSFLTKYQPDLILLDMNFQRGVNDGREGIYWLKHIKEVSPETQVILMTAYGEVEIAVQAIKSGAYDFVLKPWTNEKLLSTIGTALKFSRERKKVEQLEQTKTTLEDSIAIKNEDFITKSPAMQNLMRTLEKVAATDANILLLGENGTGKSVLALAAHRMSGRNKNSFITVDLGAISHSLFESELFGHKKGAFTDAKEDKAGRFETANEGTLFLDEIGNLDMALQSKLLTVLQNRKATRLGENREREIDVRLISATNMPIHQMVTDHQFRQDLLYRINTVEIQIPPLRERQEDIPILAVRFLEKFCRKYHKSNLRFSPASMDELYLYHWPGNIRELEHTVERSVILAEGPYIEQLGLHLNNNTDTQPNGLNLEEMEKHYVLKALDKNRGNISKAAKDLGLTRAALYRRMEKHGL
ncbi:sigma-54-dependent transcriptional regulator [Owenweeksia hongkongensis]|uniref:sigma-54-dependent transcriptional regulator n=1 Tax=Owenweeksia hongkongensis TaxID=253245 RepID=UPI003A8F9CE4